MAKRLYGDIVTMQSGSLNKRHGGMTSLKNGVVRVRVVPVNPQTSGQSQVRAAFAFLSSQWSQLTDEQRGTWDTARNDPYFYIPDPLTGVPRKANSGKALFVQVNFNLLQSTDDLGTPTVVTTGPSIGEPTDDISITSVVADASADTLVMTYTKTGTDEVLLVKATPPVSVGTMRLTSVKSALRDSSNVAGASPATINHAGKYISYTGSKVFYQVWAIQTVSGKKRLISSDSTVIQA